MPGQGRFLRWKGLGLVAILLSLSVPVRACRVDLRTSVPVTSVGGLFLVPVTVNDSVVDFLLDTGAERSVIGIAAADRLGVARDQWVSTDMQGAGGRDRRRLGRPRSLSLGGVALRRHTIAADHSLVVGPIPESVAGRPIAGLLGQDYLSSFDVDLDPAAGLLKLYDVIGCSGMFVPWPDHPAALQASRPVRDILVLPVRIDNKMLTAELDTGASLSVIMAPGMLRLGLTAGGADAVRGFGAGQIGARRQDFTMQVGTLPAAKASMLVAPVRGLRSIDMLLGADWAGSRHLWISWATNQVFVGR